MFVCAFPAYLWFVCCFGWNNYHVDGVTMKKIYYLFSCLTIATIACGTQVSPLPRTEVKQPTSEAQPVSLAAIAEPTESAPVWITTGALNVRAEANADSEILGTLEPFTEIQIFITDISGDDCYGGEWYQIDYKPEGGETVKAFVCSLWVVRK